MASSDIQQQQQQQPGSGSPKNKIVDKLGSVLLKLTGREQQWLWKEEMEKALARHGGTRMPAWRDDWDLPQEWERDPLYLCRVMIELADHEHRPEADVNSTSHKTHVEVKGRQMAPLPPHEQIERLRVILFVLTGCRDFDAAHFASPKYRELFADGTLEVVHLSSNQRIEERAEEVGRKKKRIFSHGAGEAASKAQAAIVTARGGIKKQEATNGDQEVFEGVEKADGDTIQGKTPVMSSSAPLLLGPPVLLAVAAAIIFGSSACGNNVMVCW